MMNKEQLLESIDKMTELVETCKTTTSPANMLCALNGLTEQLNLLREAVSEESKPVEFTTDELCMLNILAQISKMIVDFADNRNDYNSSLDYEVFEKLGIADKIDFY